MLNCKEVTELCSQEMERPLRLGERVSLATHLMMCTGCTNFRKQMKELRLVAQTYAAGGAVVPPAADKNPK
jgi:predicted anti-sigma-YlaC factor YlaD